MDEVEGSAAPQRWRELWLGRRLPIFVLLCLGVWLNAVDTLVASTIMPSVARELGGYAYFAWATAGYMLGAIVAGAAAGSVAQRAGLRRGFAASGLLYAIGCGLGAAAAGVWPFLVGRLVQGAGAGVVVGLCYVAVRAEFPQRSWSPMFAALSAVWGAATLLGPLVGGVFAAAHAWRGVFWSLLVQALVFAVLALRVLGDGRPAPADARRPPWRQLAQLSVAVGLVAVAGVVGDGRAGAVCVGVGLTLLWATLRGDARRSDRLLPRQAVGVSSAAGQGYAAMLALSGAAVGFSVYGAALLQARLGLDPLAAGYVVASESVGWTATAILAARVPPKGRAAMIRLGSALVTLGLAGCAATLSSAGVEWVAACGLVMGGGFGLCWSFIAQCILKGLDEADSAIGSAAIPLMQILGGVVGAALAGLAANLLGLGRGFDLAGAARAAPLLLGPFVPVAGLGAAAAWRLAGREASVTTPP